VPRPLAIRLLPPPPLREGPISAELREAFRSGHVRPEQKAALCAGGIPLAAEDRVELLAVLAADPEPTMAERAKAALFTAPQSAFPVALARPDADPRLFTYCAENCASQAGVADAMAKNLACPPAEVTRVAAHLTSAGIQALLDNLERFSSDERMMLTVARCPHANSEQRALLDELHKGELTEAEIAAAAEAEPDVKRRETLTQKIARMNVVQRLTLALKGGREERIFLIRDPNKLIQRSVLQSPRITDSEIELFSAQTNISAEVLRSISLNRLFMKNYTTAKNLCSNPKTPLDVTLHLLNRLNMTDLMKLTQNKNIPETLRSMAVKLHRKRKMSGTG
jgi:hypothetical protein